jgi:hypothetical protein
MRHLAAALALCLATPALALEVAGVKVTDTSMIAGRPLQLNGAGVRSKLFVKVYVAALYLEQKSADPAAILAADQAWMMVMTMKRDVEKAKMVGALREGFENNSKADLAALQAGLAKFEGAMGDLKEGDRLTFTYVPGAGSTVLSPGGGSATVQGKPFADALLRNWLGEKPADDGLKKKLLGG